MNPVSPKQFVYVLQNKTGLFYTGCTSNLENRLKEHAAGKSTYTKHNGPYDLIYFEACMNSQDAYHREKYLKSGSGKNFLKNRLKNYLNGGLTG